MAEPSKIIFWTLASLIFSTHQQGEMPTPQNGLSLVETIVKTLASDQLQGRAPKSKGSKKARQFIEQWLSEHQFIPAGNKSDSFQFKYPAGTNLVAVWHPDPANRQAPRVLISAHYDHMPDHCTPHQAAARSPICNGASDNAAGVAAALLAATHLQEDGLFSFALLFSDGEEDALAGSKAFVAKPSIDLDKLALVINLDIVGLNLFKGMEKHHLVFGLETTHPEFQQRILNASQGFSDLTLHWFSYGLSHGRSDHTSFLEAKSPVPSILLTDGSGGPYHSAADEWQRVNLQKVVAVAALAGRIALQAAKQSQISAAKSTAPEISTQPLVSDIASLINLSETILENRSQNGLYSLQLSKLRKNSAMLMRYKKQPANGLDSKMANQLRRIASDLLQLSRECYFQNIDSHK